MPIPEMKRNKGMIGKIIFWGLVCFLCYKFLQTDACHQLKTKIVDIYNEASSDIRSGTAKRDDYFTNANALFTGGRNNNEGSNK